MRTGWKTLIGLLALLGGAWSNYAQRPQTNAASLGVSLVQGFPGLVSQVPISLNNTGAVVAAQFDLKYPAAHLSPGSITAPFIGSNGIIRSRQISSGVIRYLVYSPQNSLLATNAQIGILPVSVPAGELTGGPMSPSNVVVAAGNASLVRPAATSSGGVIVAPIFRAEDGTIYLIFSAQTNQTYVVQATTNFVNWVNISTNTAVFNYFIVADAARLPYRFYRLMTLAGVPARTLSGINLMTNGAVSFQVNGPQGTTFIIQASTNLANWLNIATNIAGVGPTTFVDPGAGQYSTRFYRISVLP